MNGRLGHAIANICEAVALRADFLAIMARPLPPAAIRPALEPPAEPNRVRRAREHLEWCKAAAAAGGSEFDKMTNAYCVELAEDSLQHAIEEAEARTA